MQILDDFDELMMIQEEESSSSSFLASGLRMVGFDSNSIALHTPARCL